MENCLSNTSLFYKDVEQYKLDINNIIESMILNNERLVFAVVAEKSGVTNFVVRKYPELRNYILEKLVYYKEIQVINQKIDKAVLSLKKSSKTITFMAIINKCKFTTDVVYRNNYIKDRILFALCENI
jgi:hypothetical protein